MIRPRIVVHLRTAMQFARVAELADALDLGSCAERRVGSTPTSRIFYDCFGFMVVTDGRRSRWSKGRDDRDGLGGARPRRSWYIVRGLPFLLSIYFNSLIWQF